MKSVTDIIARTVRRLGVTVIAWFTAIAPSAGQATVPEQDNEEVIQLSPGAVISESDEGYLASETLAGACIRIKLRDVGSVLTVITGQFLKDTGAKNNEDLLVYTPSTEVGGYLAIMRDPETGTCHGASESCWDGMEAGH